MLRPIDGDVFKHMYWSVEDTVYFGNYSVGRVYSTGTAVIFNDAFSVRPNSLTLQQLKKVF